MSRKGARTGPFSLLFNYMDGYRKAPAALISGRGLFALPVVWREVFDYAGGCGDRERRDLRL